VSIGPILSLGASRTSFHLGFTCQVPNSGIGFVSSSSCDCGRYRLGSGRSDERSVASLAALESSMSRKGVVRYRSTSSPDVPSAYDAIWRSTAASAHKRYGIQNPERRSQRLEIHGNIGFNRYRHAQVVNTGLALSIQHSRTYRSRKWPTPKTRTSNNYLRRRTHLSSPIDADERCPRNAGLFRAQVISYNMNTETRFQSSPARAGRSHDRERYHISQLFWRFS
jgi:hypothetical protein